MKKIGVVAVIVIAVLALGPLVTLWSLNTLFPALAIPYTVQTWTATLILGGATGLFGAKFK